MQKFLHCPLWGLTFLKYFIAVIFLISLSGCFSNAGSASTEKSLTTDGSLPGRWYSAEQVKLGEWVYAGNCRKCHGVAGVSTSKWRTPLANGNYPPPPLNGSAHTWHHSFAVLLGVIDKGGVGQGGVMPAFKERLNEAEKLAVIAYIQSLWPRETYIRWAADVNK